MQGPSGPFFVNLDSDIGANIERLKAFSDLCKQAKLAPGEVRALACAIYGQFVLNDFNFW